MLSTIPRNPEKWTSSRRNQWTLSIGMGGQHRLEWVVKIARNTHAVFSVAPMRWQLQSTMARQSAPATWRFIGYSPPASNRNRSVRPVGHGYSTLQG